MSPGEQHRSFAERRILIQVSDAMIDVYKTRRRGPGRAQTYWSGPDAMTCFLENTFTPADRDLVELCRTVEHITGRTVRSFHSSSDTDADGLAAETFLFYPDGDEGRAPALERERDVRPEQHALDELTPAERTSAELARAVVDAGHLGPLVEELENGEQRREGARVALRTLVELDPDRLVQIALDTPVDQYCGGPART